MSPHRRRAMGAAAVLCLALSACGSTQSEPDSPGPSPTSSTDDGWTEGEQAGRWLLVFTGYGRASHEDDVVRLSPTSAADHDITHGALAVDQAAPADLRMTGTVTTLDQHRAGTPNPWEVGWFLWRYTDPDHFYAVALKPNGWEISKQDPAYPGKQRFLASGSTPAYPVGQAHDVEVVSVGDMMTVRVGGRALATVMDQERPYLGGGVGLYTEDAQVEFARVRVEPATALPDWALPPIPARSGTGAAGTDQQEPTKGTS